MTQGQRWLVKDRWGNPIYITEERWAHIIELGNHHELLEYELELKQTIQYGARKQDSLNPRKYRYSQRFDGLPPDNTHVVAIVLFGFRENESGQPEPNNYVTTAYLKEIG
jgi:hypothetical protein